MVQTSIRINGLKEVTSFFNNLPTQVDKNVRKDAIHDLAKNLQKRIKRRAPRGPTGWLKRSVMIEKNGEWTSVVVHAFYAMAIEEGRRRPNEKGNFLIPLEYMQQHSSVPEAPGQYVSNPTFISLRNKRARKPNPFIRPSIESWRPKISTILGNYVDKAIRSSGGNR